MNHPLLMYVGQRLRDGSDQSQRLLQAKRSIPETMSQVLSRQPLHDQERLAIGSHAVGDVTHNAGMIQPRQHQGFCEQAGCCIAVLNIFLPQDLYRHLLMCLQVDALQHCGHTPTSDLALNLKATCQYCPDIYFMPKHNSTVGSGRSPDGSFQSLAQPSRSTTRYTAHLTMRVSD